MTSATCDRSAFPPLGRVDHVRVMADGPACTGVAHGPHGPSMPDRPGSTTLSGDDARGDGPSVASVPAGLALFGSASGASDAPSGSGFALFGSGPAGAS